MLCGMWVYLAEGIRQVVGELGGECAGESEGWED